jgi:GTP-binding protein
MSKSSCTYIRAAAQPEQYPPEGLPEVAVVGRSNVGKSSFINCLTRCHGLARTSKTPGRTQLIHFFTTGFGFDLVDLPGYGFAQVPLAVKRAWKPMIEAYLSGRSSLAVVICLVDARREPSQEDGDLVEWLQAKGKAALVVATKADKLSNNERARNLKVIREALGLRWPPVAMSAVTGEGREAVLREIREVIEARGAKPANTETGKL